MCQAPRPLQVLVCTVRYRALSAKMLAWCMESHHTNTHKHLTQFLDAIFQWKETEFLGEMDDPRPGEGDFKVIPEQFIAP